MATEQYFSETAQSEFKEEDRQAWYAICSILLTIISIGLGLAFLAILIVLKIY